MFCRFLRGRMFTLTELALQTWMPRLSPSLSTPLVKWRRKHQLLHPTISKAAGYVLPFQSEAIDAPLATFILIRIWNMCMGLGLFKYIYVTNLNREQNHAQKMNKQMQEQIALVCKCVFLLYPAVRVWWTRNENKLCRWENKPFHSFPHKRIHNPENMDEDKRDDVRTCHRARFFFKRFAWVGLSKYWYFCFFLLFLKLHESLLYSGLICVIGLFGWSQSAFIVALFCGAWVE